MTKRLVKSGGKIPTDEEMSREDQELRAAETGTEPVRSRPVRGPAANGQKIRANLELSPFVNEQLNQWVKKLGMARQSLVTRYILEGMQRDSQIYSQDFSNRK